MVTPNSSNATISNWLPGRPNARWQTCARVSPSMPPMPKGSSVVALPLIASSPVPASTTSTKPTLRIDTSSQSNTKGDWRSRTSAQAR